jgi:uncharacterized membrane protein
LLGAAGLLFQPTRRAAGIGLFALTIAATPTHIYMLQRHELFAVPYWAGRVASRNFLTICLTQFLTLAGFVWVTADVFG